MHPLRASLWLQLPLRAAGSNVKLIVQTHLSNSQPALGFK